jgi:hypothetical protein
MHNGREVKDKFIDVAKAFVKAQQPRMTALEEHLKTLTTAYTETAKMYGEDPQKLPNSGEFFALLVNFLIPAYFLNALNVSNVMILLMLCCQ